MLKMYDSKYQMGLVCINEHTESSGCRGVNLGAKKFATV